MRNNSVSPGLFVLAVAVFLLFTVGAYAYVAVQTVNLNLQLIR